MSDYMKTDTKLLPYLPYPRFLLGAVLTVKPLPRQRLDGRERKYFRSLSSQQAG